MIKEKLNIIKNAVVIAVIVISAISIAFLYSNLSRVNSKLEVAESQLSVANARIKSDEQTIKFLTTVEKTRETQLEELRELKGQLTSITNKFANSINQLKDTNEQVKNYLNGSVPPDLANRLRDHRRELTDQKGIQNSSPSQ